MPTTADLRRFLTDAFNAEEITTLCADYFPDVYNNFASGQTKGARIQDLLDYCVRRDQLQPLLNELYRERPQQFAKVLGEEPHRSARPGNVAAGPAASVTNVSGGMNFSADEVNIRGDAVARDKVTTTINGNVYIIYFDEGRRTS